MREIEEETGLESSCIEDITLKYIVLRIKDNDEIRIQYVFFGNVPSNPTLIESDEGSLYWIDNTDILNKSVSATTSEIIKHYNIRGRFTDKVYVGSMKLFKGNPEITWALLEDWELPILK